jgi:tetratricopeptide (TPR) repeat protein
MKSTSRHFLLSLVLVSIASIAAAQGADDIGEIGRMIRTGQVDQAASKVEQALASKPRDAQLRFLRGVIQIEQKKTNDAIVTFQRMVEDFPELPEPYNNLAVLYAGQGQYDKSRAALELAIRTHPSYATAHENLGDIYTKMASESYTKALQLDSGNNAALVKLNLIKDLGSARPGKPTPVPAVATVAVAPPVIAPITPTQTVAAVKPAPAVAPPAVAQTQPSKSTAARNDESDVVYTAVTDWASAWSSKNVAAYLASYGRAFTPPNGEDRKSWEKERRARIEGKNSISVALDSPSVEMTAENKATVKFRQVYKADSLSVSSRKTLKLSKVDGVWKIVEETTGK